MKRLIIYVVVLFFSTSCAKKKLSFEGIDDEKKAKEYVQNFVEVYPDSVYAQNDSRDSIKVAVSRFHAVYALNIKSDSSHSLQHNLAAHFPELNFNKVLEKGVTNVWIYNGLKYLKDDKDTVRSDSSEKHIELLTIVAFKRKGDTTEVFRQLTNEVIDLRSFAWDREEHAFYHDTCNPNCQDASLMNN